MLARLQEELSRWTYSRARVAGGDAAGLGAGVPVVDRAVVLDAGVGALPRRLRHAPQQVPRVDPLDHLAGAAGQQVELLALLAPRA